MIVTRFQNLEKIQLEVEFLTPCFLGGADQNAELRAAPFKNLLRQWWRVANGNLDVNDLREKEGLLFGSVFGEQGSASKVRQTVIKNSVFSITDAVFDFKSTFHPEVPQKQNGQIVGNGTNVSNALYLGYGPISYSRNGNQCRKYINPDSRAIWSLEYPKHYRDDILRTLALIHCYGTIGSRCRNGYGSLALRTLGNDIDLSIGVHAATAAVLIAGKKYPHGIGKDDKGLLVWEKSCSDWKSGMELLAKTYLELRTSFKFPQGPQQSVSKRHILGYPVTHHSFQAWGGGNGRMPSQVRLMIKRNSSGNLVARIAHIPHKLPKNWNEAPGSELSVWQEVHAFLDKNNDFNRVKDGL